MTATGVLIVGHGSRRSNSNAEFEEAVERVRRAHPEYLIAHGYVELAAPSLDEAMLAILPNVQRLVVFPLFLFAAGHVKNDISLAIVRNRRKFPHVDICAASPLGVHPLMTKALMARMVGVAAAHEPDRGETVVVVVGRGSSDPDANGDFCKQVRLLYEGSAFLAVYPAFIGITHPQVPLALDIVARLRPRRLIVAPYFLFNGVLIERLARQVCAFAESHRWITASLAPPLGVSEAVLELIRERIGNALAGHHPSPCDTCQYRIALPSLEQHVGGLNALLWSVRHSFTHTQAMPHEHAHPPLKKHVFVCTNSDCADRGSMAVLSKLRRMLKEKGLSNAVKVTKTLCMGRCGEGPTVAVYPDGIWYRGVQPADVEPLVEEHLVNDKLIGHLVDNIMQ